MPVHYTGKIADAFLSGSFSKNNSPVKEDTNKNNTNVLPSTAAVDQEQDLRRHLQQAFVQNLEPYNLHHGVLGNHCGLTTVPYCTKEEAVFFGFDRIPQWAHPNPASSTVPITTLFIGRLPLVPKYEDVALAVFSTTGVMPLRVYIAPSASTNKSGKITSPLAQVDVPSEYAPMVVAHLHRRVWFDQTCLHFAETKEQIRLAHNYGKMLDRNQKARFNHRCRSAISCVPSQQNQGPASANHQHHHHQIIRETRNLYNPLCPCQSCTNFLERNTQLGFLHQEYLPLVTHTTPFDIQRIIAAFNNQNRQNTTMMTLQDFARQVSRKFSLDDLIRTHSYLKPEDLVSEVERNHYVPVSAAALWCCRQNCENIWPFWKYATRDGDNEWDADLFCCHEYEKRNSEKK